MPEIAGAAPFEMLARVLQRLLETIAAERLQQVVDRVHLEGLQRVLVVGGDEHDRRHPIGADLLDDAKAVAHRHLHVEEHQIGMLMLNRADRLLAVGAFADELDVFFLRQQPDDTLARHRFVVHHHRSNFAHATPSAIIVLDRFSDLDQRNRDEHRQSAAWRLPELEAMRRARKDAAAAIACYPGRSRD